jgi:hypothetical protein
VTEAVARTERPYREEHPLVFRDHR